MSSFQAADFLELNEKLRTHAGFEKIIILNCNSNTNTNSNSNVVLRQKCRNKKHTSLKLVVSFLKVHISLHKRNY